MEETINITLDEDMVRQWIKEEIAANLTAKEIPDVVNKASEILFNGLSQEELNKRSDQLKKLSPQYNNVKNKPEMGKHYAPNITTKIEGKLFAFGNSKLPINVLIVNVTSGFNCPSKNTCHVGQDFCYACNAETSRPTVGGHAVNMEYLADLARETPEKWEGIFTLIRGYIEEAARQGLEIKYLRLNESGDFKTKTEIAKFDQFAAEIKQKYGIETHAYSANIKLKSAFEEVENMNIIASNPKIKGKMVTRNFYAVSAPRYRSLPDTRLAGICNPVLKHDPKRYGYYYKCPCDIAAGEKCNGCRVCWLALPGHDEQGNVIPKFAVICKVHGRGASKFKQNFSDRMLGFKVNENIDNEHDGYIPSTDEQLANIKHMQQVATNSENNTFIRNNAVLIFDKVDYI